MQLAYSTLGCPEWTFDEIIHNARQWGFAGVEFRGIGATVDLEQVPEFSPARIAETRQRLQDAGVQPTCLSSSVFVLSSVCDEVDRRQAIATAEHYIDMAKGVGAPFVRLFGGEFPATMLPAEATDKASDMLRRIGDFAQQRGVTVLVETHDALTDTVSLSGLLQWTNHPAVQALWDLDNTYRQAGETPTQTMRHLGDRIRYMHIKDSVVNTKDESSTLVPVGDGDVPIRETLHALKESGYDGFLTFEWEKRWHPELDAPEIVFPQYARQMGEWLGTV